MQRIIKIFWVFVIIDFIFLAPIFCYSQGSAGENAIIETTKIVDMPTGGLILSGHYYMSFSIYNSGGVLGEFNISPAANLMFGISYNVNGLIGSNKISFQNLPGFVFCWRFLDETLSYPAFIIGINTQGTGGYLSDKKRFLVYSPGIYLSSSKNFRWFLGSIALHTGINYSFEPTINDRMINFYAGLEQSLGKFASINMEYNSTLNDRNRDVMSKMGLLNSSLRVSISKGVTLQLQIRDILNHQVPTDAFSRYMVIEIVKMY